MFQLPQTVLQQAPQYWKLQPVPVVFQTNIEPAPGGFMCEVSLVNRRNYIDPFEDYEVYLPHSNNRVIHLKPAMGELRRSPKRFVAIVFMNNNPKAFRTVAINAGQKLMVV